MHSRFSHVMYNCLAVNRAPFRSWLYKIKRAKSEMCRFGCHCTEDANHVLFHCKYINSERQVLKNLCLTENLDFTLINIMTHPSLQISTEQLLLAFFKSSKWLFPYPFHCYFVEFIWHYVSSDTPPTDPILGPLPHAFSLLPPCRAPALLLRRWRHSVV